MNKRNRNNSRKNRYVLVSLTIVKNTSFLNNCNTPFDQSLTHNETKFYPSIVMEEEEERKKEKKEFVPSNVIRRGACGSPTLISPLVSLDTRYAL